MLTVNVVCVPVENGMTWPSAVTHGRPRHPPAVPPQSASVLHVLKRVTTEQHPGQVAPGQPVVALLSSVEQPRPARDPPLHSLDEVVVQRFSPVVPWSRYVFGIGRPGTIGAQTSARVVVVTFAPHGAVMTVTLVLVVVVVVVVGAATAATVVLVVDGHCCPAGLQTSVRISLSVRRGGPDETAFVMILHLPGRLFFFVSRTTTAPSEHVGPAAVTPSVDVPLQRPFTMTFFNPVALHAP